ncbi:UNVERIFIED_CONTAM: hypothetical protein Slati_0807400 [Sesamum latifolium]|uniref:Reverse transcriptase domain-containing protein n=1 Tax=Sesamum latifolium TaxID=2727402 RepID=A0AAW2XP08_9LAMI
MEVLQLILHQFIDQDGDFSYHWKCQDLGLFQLCFADDLLLFYKADEPSIRLFRRGLHLFASLSGLHANPQKSQLILSKAAQPGREALLASLGFQEGHLPIRYLGLPLITSRLTISDCQPLLQKIDSRIQGWDDIRRTPLRPEAVKSPRKLGVPSIRRLLPQTTSIEDKVKRRLILTTPPKTSSTCRLQMGCHVDAFSQNVHLCRESATD